MQIRKYEEKDLKEMIHIWNEVVEEGVAFPQEEFLDEETGKAFFASQSYCGVADDNGKITGLYILHPNNVYEKGQREWLVLINNIFNGLAYPFAGSLGSGLRAAGDVKFTMIVSITLTIAARLFFSALFGLVFGWGVIGIAIGMSMDLVFRGMIFIRRYRSQKWTKFQLI